MIPIDLLRDAQALAKFSNLSAADVDDFRHNFEGFLPKGFWNPPRWRIFQAFLREAWSGFPIDNAIPLISWASLVDDRVLPVTDDLSQGPDPNPTVADYKRTWPFQRAVMCLAIEPWRARFCSQCGNRFVADEPNRKFCSDKCFQIWRTQAKRVSWSKHGREWRANRRKSKQHAKTKSGR